MMHVLGVLTVLSVFFGSAAAGSMRKRDVICAAVQCKVSNCLSPKTLSGECCPVCPDPIGRSCWYKRKFYRHGTSFKDDCNTCSCNNGRVLCTKIGCLHKTCFYKGKFYTHGSSFKDDCNTCSCRDGRVACTKKGCLGCRYGDKYYKEGEKIPQKDPCMSCICRRGKVDCDTMMCLAVYCKGQYKRPGVCCPVCPPKSWELQR